MKCFLSYSRATFLKEIGNYEAALMDLDRIEDICLPIVQEEENEDLVVRIKSSRSECERLQEQDTTELHIPKLIRDLMHIGGDNGGDEKWQPLGQTAAGRDELRLQGGDDSIVDGLLKPNLLKLGFMEQKGMRFVAQTEIRPGIQY